MYPLCSTQVANMGPPIISVCDVDEETPRAGLEEDGGGGAAGGSRRKLSGAGIIIITSAIVLPSS